MQVFQRFFSAGAYWRSLPNLDATSFVLHKLVKIVYCIFFLCELMTRLKQIDTCFKPDFLLLLPATFLRYLRKK